MRLLFVVLTFLIFNFLIDFSVWSSVAIAIWVGYVIYFLSNLNNSIAFREYILVMYGLNYLFAPALTFELTQQISIYKMRLDPAEYFGMAIPAIFFLHAGLFSIKTKIFTYNFNLTRIQALLNQSLLKQLLIIGVLLTFTGPFFPGELAFIVYLLSGIKYVAAFGLYILDKKKYKWYLFGLLFIEAAGSLRVGMFHDLVIWILFFSMLWTYLTKPDTTKKLVLGVTAILCFFILQTAKGTYRAQLVAGGGGLSSFSSAVSKNAEGGGLFSFENFALSLTRANQGWIFSSSVDYMNRRKNFQGTTLLKQYAEAAILPRFMAPNKLEAGDKKIFNEFSGAHISLYSSTSMGLGLLADGYISYGTVGTMLFCLFFGIMCALVFKVIEKWSRISPIFALFFFPLLNYAVRPDCESQTWMGHIVKGLVAFSIVMYFISSYIRRKTKTINLKDVQEDEIVLQPHLLSNPIAH
ncbi:MAG: hypothetical protein M3Y85_00110 [Bacteroidota bacterium]|nr:hypothetical protein [Bacteroidota bacterium]